jgi:soluble lytic murein transglycosylase-like protein
VKRRSGTRRPLLRLTAGIAAGAALLALVPPVRAAAVGARDLVVAASIAAREVDTRRARTARHALRYRISMQLAADIERAAMAEGIDPDLAFRLVQVESGFHERAVSSAGALGLTQLMPATARELQPGITREQIFERGTNLRLGFRYLHWLLRLYDGRLDEALHAYNRGPGTVARVRAAGGDPANGYADRVLGQTSRDPYGGNGFVPASSAAGN